VRYIADTNLKVDLLELDEAAHNLGQDHVTHNLQVLTYSLSLSLVHV